MHVYLFLFLCTHSVGCLVVSRYTDKGGCVLVDINDKKIATVPTDKVHPLKNQDNEPIISVHADKIAGRIVDARLSGRKENVLSDDDENKQRHPNDYDFRSTVLAIESKILNDGREKDNIGVVDSKCCDECSRASKLTQLASSAASALPSQVSFLFFAETNPDPICDFLF